MGTEMDKDDEKIDHIEEIIDLNKVSMINKMSTKKYKTKCLAIDIKLQEQYESGAEKCFKDIHQQGR